MQITTYFTKKKNNNNNKQAKKALFESATPSRWKLIRNLGVSCHAQIVTGTPLTSRLIGWIYKINSRSQTWTKMCETVKQIWKAHTFEGLLNATGSGSLAIDDVHKHTIWLISRSRSSGHPSLGVSERWGYGAQLPRPRAHRCSFHCFGSADKDLLPRRRNKPRNPI